MTSQAMTNAYAGSLLELSDRLTQMADEREERAVELGARLCREREVTPAQIEDALIPRWARIRGLRKSAATAARSAKEMR